MSTRLKNLSRIALGILTELAFVAVLAAVGLLASFLFSLG